jgi:DNA-directed RNA polymerase subunit RPC12/RpoP
MKENPSKRKPGKIADVKSCVLTDVITTCPKCGGEVALWSESPETTCIFCRYRVFERETTIH